jgi:predicted adenylyl cyclase CyaB
MVRWIEFKAPVTNLVALDQQVRALGAEFMHERREQDLCLDFPDGILVLREPEGASADLLTYRRESLGEFQSAEVEVAEVGAPREVGAMLRGRFGVRAEVEKTRRTFQWRRTQIQLDQVFGLGMFVELQTLVTGEDDEAAKSELREALATLGIDVHTSEIRSYADMLLEQQAR